MQFAYLPQCNVITVLQQSKKKTKKPKNPQAQVSKQAPLLFGKVFREVKLTPVVTTVINYHR